MADRYDERATGEDRPWRRERYGSRFDQDRGTYGSGWDSGARTYGRGEDRSFAADDDLHPDYVTWREEQLRAHDRDYEAWRSERQRHYDNEYRRSREVTPYARAYGGGSNMSRGMRPQDVDTASGDYYRRTGGSFGMGDGPSGRLEPSFLHRSYPRRPMEPAAPRRDDEVFDDATSQVRAATDGWDTRHSARDFEFRHWRDRHRHDHD